MRIFNSSKTENLSLHCCTNFFAFSPGTQLSQLGRWSFCFWSSVSLNFSWAPKLKTQGLHCWSYSQNRRTRTNIWKVRCIPFWIAMWKETPKYLWCTALRMCNTENVKFEETVKSETKLKRNERKMLSCATKSKTLQMKAMQPSCTGGLRKKVMQTTQRFLEQKGRTKEMCSTWLMSYTGCWK